MQKSIPNGRFVNITRFRIVDSERLIMSVLISFVDEFAVQSEDIVGQMKRKSFDVFAAALITKKFSPRGEQIFDGNDIMIDMMRPHFPLSHNSASILNRIKEGYLIWANVVPHISKGARYTIGARIENKFLDLLELVYIAYFTEKEKKAEKIADCILVLDTLKFLISVAWEGKLISNKQYEDVALKLEEVGKMFGGWKKNLNNPEKKNRDV